VTVPAPEMLMAHSDCSFRTFANPKSASFGITPRLRDASDLRRMFSSYEWGSRLGGERDE